MSYIIKDITTLYVLLVQKYSFILGVALIQLIYLPYAPLEL